MKARWLQDGVLNTFDHLITRFSDAALSILLLWLLSPEVFSRVVLAQAWVAPVLLVFICPESALYRDFAKWRAEGRRSLSRRLTDIRLFGWAKLGAGFAISPLMGHLGDVPTATMIWAFSFMIAPQVIAADREYLRMELRLRELSLLSLFQKATLLGGTAFVALHGSGSFWPLAWVALGSLCASAFLSYLWAKKFLGTVPETEIAPPPLGQTLWQTARDFSSWYHVQGVLTLWVYSMDLWALGIAGATARTLGLYAVGLKVANFAMAVPQALTNLFTVWLGRQFDPQEARIQEESLLRKMTLVLFVLSALQWVVLALLGPWIFEILSRGKWSAEEISQVHFWMRWILAGGVLLNVSLPVNQWISLRLPIRKLLLQVALPWAVLSLAVYLGCAFLYGPDGVAKANLWVAALLVGLVFRFRRQFSTRVSTL